MKPIIIYGTKSGNTEKVAQAIATELNCPCIKVPDKTGSVDLNNYDTVFIGTGIYKGQPNADLLSYLQDANLKTRKQFALFMTCFGWGKGVADQNVIETLTQVLASKGQNMLSNRFSCFGGGLGGLVKRGHPDKEELAAAKKWAKNITNP
jgi:flavodoxin